MPGDPLVSVIVPLFNYERYIRDCLRSVLAQDYPNFELIVVDDASRDSSLKIARSFASVQVLVLAQKRNAGYSAAKNVGIKRSQGELIVTLDADDMLADFSLTRRAHAIRDTGAPFVHGWACEIGPRHTFDGARARSRKRRGRKAQIHAQCVMLTREMHQKYGLYDESLRSKADKEMWFRLRPRVEVVKIPDIVAYYRKHGRSMQAYRKSHRAYNQQIRRRFYKLVNMRAGNGLSSDNTEMLET